MVVIKALTPCLLGFGGFFRSRLWSLDLANRYCIYEKCMFILLESMVAVQTVSDAVA